jgi:hypothetical protein
MKTREDQRLQDDRDYYRRQAEEARDQISQMYQQQETEAERRRQERQREREKSYREADNWPQALQKQRQLMQREAALEAQDEREMREAAEPPDSLDHYFRDTIDACARALELWPLVAGERQAEVNRLLDQIEQINIGVKLEVARRLQAENHRFAQTADAMRTMTPSEWLDW